MHLELHVGLPRDAGADLGTARWRDAFRWKHVAATFPGPQARLVPEGHGVDGELGVIGTSEPRTVEAALILLASMAPRDLPSGSRIEAELVLDGGENGVDPDVELEALGIDRLAGRFAQALGPGWCAVPAPAFEGHTTTTTSAAGLDRPGAALRAVAFFEATAFQDPPRSVITVVGRTPTDVLRSQRTLEHALAGQGAEARGSVVEALVGAWRP